MNRESNNKIAYFNILRFIGAISIAIFLHYNDHLLPYFGKNNVLNDIPILEYLSKNSYVFVEMFFIISGILFSFSYFNRIVNGMKLKDFLSNRVIRIYPLVIITSIFMYSANLIVYRIIDNLWSCGTLSIWELFVDITLGGKALLNTPNTLNGPIWYISVLMTCYIIAFFISRIYKKYNSKLLFIIPIILGIMIRYSGANIVFFNNAISRGLVSFFIGIMLGFFLRKYKYISNKNRIILKTCIVLELVLYIFLLTRNHSEIFISDNIFCYSFLFFPELLILFYDVKWINRICETRFVKYLGKISYGIYLWNFPILITFFILYKYNIMTIPVASWQFIGLNIIVHIIIATFSYYFIEKGWKDFFEDIIEKIRMKERVYITESNEKNN